MMSWVLPARSCSASLTGAAKGLNCCSILLRILLSLRPSIGFVGFVVELGRLRDLKLWARLS